MKASIHSRAICLWAAMMGAGFLAAPGNSDLNEKPSSNDLSAHTTFNNSGKVETLKSKPDYIVVNADCQTLRGNCPPGPNMDAGAY